MNLMVFFPLFWGGDIQLRAWAFHFELLQFSTYEVHCSTPRIPGTFGKQGISSIPKYLSILKMDERRSAFEIPISSYFELTDTQ